MPCFVKSFSCISAWLDVLYSPKQILHSSENKESEVKSKIYTTKNNFFIIEILYIKSKYCFIYIEISLNLSIKDF